MIVIDSVEILQRQFFSQPIERGFFFGFFFPTILCIDISLVSRQTTILAAVIPNKLQSSKYDTLKAYWIVTRKKQFKREKAKSKKKRQKTNQQRCFIFILFFFLCICKWSTKLPCLLFDVSVSISNVWYDDDGDDGGNNNNNYNHYRNWQLQLYKHLQHWGKKKQN